VAQVNSVSPRFAPEMNQRSYEVTIDETTALNEEILRVNATDRDSFPPHNRFVFETTSNIQWFGVYEDGRVYLKKVSE